MGTWVKETGRYRSEEFPKVRLKQKMAASRTILLSCLGDCIGASAKTLAWLAPFASKVQAIMWHMVKNTGYLSRLSLSQAATAGCCWQPDLGLQLTDRRDALQPYLNPKYARRYLLSKSTSMLEAYLQCKTLSSLQLPSA